MTAVVEKPAREDAPSNLAVVGRYVLAADIWSLLEKTPPVPVMKFSSLMLSPC